MSDTYKIDMTTGAIFPKLLKFSVPLILSSLLQLLFNAADIIVVGRFSGDKSLAAVGSTSSLVNLLVNLFMGLSVGANVVSAHFLGAGKTREVSATVHTTVLVSLYSGIALTVIGVFGSREILKLMQSPEDVLSLSTLYLKIFFAGITSTVVYNFGSALLRAKGDTRRPLYFLFFSGLVNVALNLLFVIVFKMDVAGVALATVISQTIAAVLVIRCLIYEEGEFHLSLKKLKIDRDILLKIIKIGLPTGIQGMIFSLSNVIIQSSVNSFGSTLIAGNAAACSLEGFVYTAMNGFSQGALTFGSQNYGAKRYDRIKRLVLISQVTILFIGCAMAWTMTVFGRSLLRIYSDNSDVIEAGMLRMKIIFNLYALCGMMDAMANSIRSIGKSLLPTIVTLIGVCGFRLTLIFTLFRFECFHTPTFLFWIYPISWLVTLLIHYICFFVEMKKIVKKT